MAHPALAATLPSEAEAGVAKETSRLLAARLKKGAPMQLRILDDEAAQATVKSPMSLPLALSIGVSTMRPGFGMRFASIFESQASAPFPVTSYLA